MADTKLRREDEIDKQANEMFASHPDLQEQEQAAGKNAGVGAGIDQAESYANDPKNSSKNISDTQEGEDSAGRNGLYNQSATKQRFSAKGLLKKGGPAGGIFGLIFGGIFGIGVLLSPSLAVVHLKEVLTDDLGDAVAAMDVRSSHVLRTKLKDLGKPFSSCTVKIRCGLRGMSDRQIKSFERAGIEVELAGEKSSLTRKSPIKSLTFTNSAGEKVVIDNPSKLGNLISDKNIRNQLRRAYNPKFYMIADRVGFKTLTEKLRTSKARKLTSNDPKELDNEIDKATAGEKVQIDNERRPTSEEDSEEQKKNDADSKNGADEFNKGVNDAVDIDSTFKNASKSMTSGVLKGFMLTGALDTACSVYGGIGAVSALAKTKRAMQLAQYAMVFLNFADSVKRGDATPEQASHIGNILTHTDTRKTIQNESSKMSTSGLSMVDNPDYQKSAFDAQAIKAGFHNDAPVLNSRSQNYLVGGGMVGTLDSVRNRVTSIIGFKKPKDVKDKCATVQNIFVRIGAGAGGVILGASSFGATTVASIALSTAVSMAMPLIQSYLGKIIAGKVVSSSTKGVDAGNAIFSGTGVILGGVAQARGMKPASKSDLKQYLALSENIKNEYIALESEDDQKDPFNINRQYSFAGQVARKLLPVAPSGNFASIKAISGLFSLSTTTTLPSYAALGFNADRFSKCSDIAYESLGIDADVMCNVRYTMSAKELAMNPENVVNQMLSSGYINDDGEPQSDYSDWLKNCVNRTDGWGETSESDGSGNDGADCVKDTQKNSLFRVYTMDRSIEEGMDNGPAQGSEATQTANTGTMTIGVASYNFCHEENNKCPIEKSERKSPIISGVIKGSLGQQLDIIGAQEVTKKTLAAVTAETGYVSYPTASGNPLAGLSKDKGRAILWNPSKFTMLSSGRLPDSFGMVGNDGSAATGDKGFPWVQLKITGAESKSIYVLSIHSPRGRYAPPEVRINNAKKMLQWARSVASPDSTVIITGDFNRSGNQEYRGSSDDGTAGPKYKGGAYCELTGGILIHASDLARNVSATEKCPTNKADLIPFDQIYVSSDKSIQASNWGYIDKGEANRKSATDHSPAYVTLNLPGSGGDSSVSSSAGGLSWPLDKKRWDSKRAAWLNSHIGTGTAWGDSSAVGATGNKGAGIATDIGVNEAGLSANEPVYAMLGGTVISTNLCNANDGIAIKSTVNGKTVGIAYMHGVNKKFKKGDTVTAGQQIMTVGAIGCNVSGAHLHLGIVYDGKYICPQDVFLGMDKGETINWDNLTKKANPGCGR